ncbi:MAG: hypothetical protein ACRD07_18210, partial [Acidimicrobiales bacterium]
WMRWVVIITNGADMGIRLSRLLRVRGSMVARCILIVNNMTIFSRHYVERVTAAKCRYALASRSDIVDASENT